MKKILPVLLLLIIVLVRFLTFYSVKKPFKNGDHIRITSRVVSEPLRFDKNQYLKLFGLKIYLPLYPEISYGDNVIIEGTVNSDKLDNPKLIEIKNTQNSVYVLRNRLISYYQENLPSEYSGLIAGMVIGSKSGISSAFWEKLKNSGTAHVVVASGMNVTLVAGFLISFFNIFIKRQKALILTFLGIWIYAVLAGFEAPIIRAAIMGSVGFFSEEVGRLNSAIKALFISAIIMLLLNPAWVSDVGFLLSFFATLSLILFQKRIYSKITFVPTVLREDLSTSFAAQIGVFPILYYSFGQVNIFSPLINALVLWTVPPLTTLGMIAGVIGLIVPTLGKMILFLTYPLSLWFIKVVYLFG